MASAVAASLPCLDCNVSETLLLRASSPSPPNCGRSMTSWLARALILCSPQSRLLPNMRLKLAGDELGRVTGRVIVWMAGVVVYCYGNVLLGSRMFSAI